MVWWISWGCKDVWGIFESIQGKKCRNSLRRVSYGIIHVTLFRILEWVSGLFLFLKHQNMNRIFFLMNTRTSFTIWRLVFSDSFHSPHSGSFYTGLNWKSFFSQCFQRSVISPKCVSFIAQINLEKWDQWIPEDGKRKQNCENI